MGEAVRSENLRALPTSQLGLLNSSLACKPALFDRCEAEKRENYLRFIFAKSKNSSLIVPEHIANKCGATIAHAQPKDFGRCSSEYTQVDQIRVLRKQRESMLRRIFTNLGVG